MSGCESCLSRRDFIGQAALLAAAAALAACGVDAATSPGLSSAVTVNVNDYASLANVGGIALVSGGGQRMAVVRTGAGSFVALSRTCPHQGETVNISGSGFYCPGHGATFNSTGLWTGGQRTSSLHAYTTSYNSASGELTIS